MIMMMMKINMNMVDNIYQTFDNLFLQV